MKIHYHLTIRLNSYLLSTEQIWKHLLCGQIEA